ncbi:PKS-NRPS hybrid synthetase [Glycine soja]
MASYSIFKKLSSRFPLFPAALSLVRGGSKVECSGEGEVSGVKLCGGRWRQTRYADGVCSSRTYGWLPDQMDEDEWMYEIMSERADMDYENAESCGANEPHVDCSDAFKTSQCREDVLQWARSVAFENGFVAVILRSDTNTGSGGRSTFVLIGCERSGEYKCRKKEFIRRDTGTRKCGCPFKLRCKPVAGGEGWMVKLICGVHNHELTKSLVGHPYAGNILLTLKEHNANSCTTIKQIYNARSAFRSSIRGSDLEMQHLMKLLERDQYIYWHRIKDEDVVRDIFWCHPDSVKLVNACNLVFLIDSTYKTNRYRLPLLDFVGMTPAGMTFSAGFAYVEGERVNNLVWALQRFRGLFLNRDALPGVIVIDRDQALMNAVKDVFPECTNLLCIFHINKNFDECLKKFEVACAPWPIFVDYVKETWIIPHKEKFVSTWTNKVMHLGNTTTNRVESVHSSLKRLLQNNIGDLCSVWDAVNNMIALQHTQIKASFETSTHVVGHVFQKTLYRRLLGMVSRYALNQIAAEFERVHYAGKNPSSCGCMVRTTLGLPCACELSKYPEVDIKDVMETIYQKFEELDVCGKFTLRSKLWEIAHPDQNSMCPPPAKVNTKGALKKTTSRNPRSTKRDPSCWEYVDALESQQNSNSSVRRTASSSEQPNRRTMMPMLDQFQPFMHDFIDKIVEVKGDGNCGYRSVAGLLGMGQDSWSVVRNHLLKELANFSKDYIKLFGGTERYEELRMSLLVDGLTKFEIKFDVYICFIQVTTDKWMDITDMGHVIASRYNVIIVSLPKQQSMTFFPLRSQPLTNSSLHRIIRIGHVYDNHFVEAKSWPNPYISRMQHYKSFVMFKRDYNTLKLTDKQFLDEIYYRQPFTYAGNQFRFQCKQLKDDADVNTMLMCNHEFLFVGPIELLCSIARTPNGILNLLETTMTPTHDALLYYNGRWNMSRQNEFVGYSFTGKNPKNFDIPTGCTMDELKDLIKQVAPRGIPPYGVDETQMVTRLFFWKPIIKFEIIELKTNEDVMKVLIESNYWKKIGPIEILAVFSKPLPQMEDELSLSQN